LSPFSPPLAAALGKTLLFYGCKIFVVGLVTVVTIYEILMVMKIKNGVIEME